MTEFSATLFYCISLLSQHPLHSDQQQVQLLHRCRFHKLIYFFFELFLFFIHIPPPCGPVGPRWGHFLFDPALDCRNDPQDQLQDFPVHLLKRFRNILAQLLVRHSSFSWIRYCRSPPLFLRLQEEIVDRVYGIFTRLL